MLRRASNFPKGQTHVCLMYPRYTGMRAMQSPADPNKVLVETKTDGRPVQLREAR